MKSHTSLRSCWVTTPELSCARLIQVENSHQKSSGIGAESLRGHAWSNLLGKGARGSSCARRSESSESGAYVTPITVSVHQSPVCCHFFQEDGRYWHAMTRTKRGGSAGSGNGFTRKKGATARNASPPSSRRSCKRTQAFADTWKAYGLLWPNTAIGDPEPPKDS